MNIHLKQIMYHVLFLLMALPSLAHAYTDPGSGLLLWQLLGSFFIGLLFYFRRIIAFIKKLFRKNAPH